MSVTQSNVITSHLRAQRQTRRFTDEPVPKDVITDILEVARWTGSWKNDQPWHFVVVTDAQTRKALAEVGPHAAFLEDAPCVVVVVLDGENPRGEPFDEGRVSERIMLAASAHGLGAGTGWFALGNGEARAREILGIPEGKVVRQALGIGRPQPGRQSSGGGRKPLDEIVSWESWGAS